tara:strand:+ start:668 stop:2227 length:1560 start_codon:yes stop_codon:yes gene_type:complete
MAYIPLRNIGAGGIVTDQDPYDLELTQFPVGDNVSFHEGRIGKSLGHSERISTSYAPTHIQGWMAQTTNTVIVGTLNKIYRFNGTTLTNVSKTSDTFDYTNSPRWQSAQLGTAVMMNNGSDVPQFMQPDATRFLDLTAWPSGVKTQCLKPYKSFLVMAGYEATSTKHPFTVRWSDEYEPTGVPTDYSISSTTNLAGENTLSGNNGDLIDQLTLNNSQIIYAERGVFAMDFIGAPFVFSFREVFSDDGIINRGACAEFMGKHLVVGHNDIYVHDGNQKQSIAEKRVRRTFFNAITDTRSIYCQTINDRSEIWICYSDVNASDSQSANRALVYNWVQNAFTFIDLPDLRALSISEKMGVTFGNWNNAVGTWDNTTAYWSNISQSTEANALKLFGAGYSASKVYTMNDTHAAAGTPILATLEATKIDLDQVIGKATNTIKKINGILPQIDGQGTVEISVGSSMSPQDGVTWGDPQTYNIESDYKIDVRSSGRYLALKVESNSASDYWQLTGLDIDISEVAAR